MTGSLKALLAGTVDFAGLFPPAKLPLDEAFRDYAAYRKSDDAWMLSHFVIPALRLAALREFSDEIEGAADPYTFSALLGQGDDPVEWQESFANGLDLVNVFLDEHGGRAKVPVLEIRLPAALTLSSAGTARMADFVEAIETSIVASGIPAPCVFLELPPSGGAEESRRELARIAAGHMDDIDFGLKLRTGGLEAAAFPTVHEVAALIRDCCDAGCRWKATAGLHHPLRKYRVEVGAKMHGFLNLLTATALTHAGAIDDEERNALLECGNIAEFQFDDMGLSWRDRSASLGEIEAARKDGFLSFGSCSFDDPREDLKALDLM